jgi:hypothetical protein
MVIGPYTSKPENRNSEGLIVIPVHQPRQAG